MTLFICRFCKSEFVAPIEVEEGLVSSCNFEYDEVEEE